MVLKGNESRDAVFPMPQGTNRLTIQTSLMDGTSWPASLVYTVQRSIDGKTWHAMSPAVTINSATIEAGISPAAAYVRVFPSTFSADNESVGVSFYAYTDHTS